MPTEGEPSQEEQQMEWQQREWQQRGGEGEVVGQEGERRGLQSPITKTPAEDGAGLV